MKKMITPSALQTQVTAIPVEGKYNWEKQVLEGNSCKATTSFQTFSGNPQYIDDYPQDNIGW